MWNVYPLIHILTYFSVHLCMVAYCCLWHESLIILPFFHVFSIDRGKMFWGKRKVSKPNLRLCDQSRNDSRIFFSHFVVFTFYRRFNKLQIPKFIAKTLLSEQIFLQASLELYLKPILNLQCIQCTLQYWTETDPINIIYVLYSIVLFIGVPCMQVMYMFF